MSGALITLVPAAGASSRMRGADKLLEDIDGVPLLQLVVRRALSVTDRVIVTLPADPTGIARLAALPDDPRITDVEVYDASTGMAASFRAAAPALLGNFAGAMILPADMPDLDAEDLRMVVQTARAYPDRVVRATTTGGQPGHPVVLPARLFCALSTLTGDKGPRDILKAEGPDVITVSLPGTHALTDLDTPEAWAVWRQSRARVRA